MRQSDFINDGFAGKVFCGFTFGERWNGFACPYFTFEQAQEVVRAYCEQGSRAWYDSDEDSFVFEYAVEHADELDVFLAEEVADCRLYLVGAFQWTWHEKPANTATAH